MRLHLCGVGLMVALVGTVCLPESAVAQAFSRTKVMASGSVSGSAFGQGGQAEPKDKYGLGLPGEGALQQQANSSASASRSVSFSKNGKRVSIRENGSGITVTVNGKSVQARNADQLRKKSPAAYRLYADHMDAAQARGFAGGAASGFAGGAAGPMKNGRGANRQAINNSFEDRRVSLVENGREISIAENARGITVTVNGKTIRARNADELKRRNLEAYNLYMKHLAGPDVRPEGVNAKDLMRAELNKMRDANKNNPQLGGLLEKMLRDVGN